MFIISLIVFLSSVIFIEIVDLFLWINTQVISFSNAYIISLLIFSFYFYFFEIKKIEDNEKRMKYKLMNTFVLSFCLTYFIINIVPTILIEIFVK